MVVVPTGTHVELRYGWTGVDLGSYALTGAGVVGAVVLARRPMRREDDADDLWLDGPDPIVATGPPADDALDDPLDDPAEELAEDPAEDPAEEPEDPEP
jgi:hypothetical protein